jgi:amidophosphoribosyltransferase
MCGIIGIYGNSDISIQLFYALKALQHRGQTSSGFITYDGHIHVKKQAGMVTELVRTYSDETELLDHYPGSVGIGHTRYSTYGMDDEKSLKRNAQPEYLINPFIASAFNGNLYNLQEVIPQCWRKPRTDCDIQALLLPMAQALPAFTGINHDTILEAGEHVMNTIKGSYANLYLTTGKITPYLVGMTDPYKIRPMVVGHDDEGEKWVIASESVVLKRLGMEEFKDVEGGTIIVVDSNREEPKQKQLVKKKKHICMFEFIYFANAASVMENKSIHKVRVELGKTLARKCPCDADIIVPVPESGRRYAIGYSQESGIPLEEGLAKAERDRSFIMQTQEKRDELVEHNLYAINEVLDGKNVVLTDDSLIRGTNMRKVVKKVRKAGAKKVHVRIGCPPVVAPCYLGIDMRSKKEFIAVDEKTNELRSWDDISSDIGADSLGYSSMEDLRRVIIGAREDIDICYGCLDFPNGYPPDYRDDVGNLFEKDKDGVRAYE